MSNFGFFSACWSHFESLVNSSFSFANLSFSSPDDFYSNSNRSRNSPVISVCVSASQKKRVGETLLLWVSTSIWSTDTSFTESASPSISVQEMSVFFFQALEFEVASDLYRIRRSCFFFNSKEREMVDEFYRSFHHPNGKSKSACYRSSNSNYRSEANVYILAEYVLPWVFDKMPDHGSSWNYLGTTASCMPWHYSRWLLGVFCPPQRIP